MRTWIVAARRLPLVLLCSCALAAVAHAAGTTLYKWVDQDGVTHYSDRPEPGAQRVQVGAAQGYKPSPAAARAQPAGARPPTGAAPRRDAAAPAYTRVTIESPKAGQAFVNEGSSIQVSAAVEPQLAPDHQLWFVLDGQKVEGLPTAGTTAVLEVGRGEHTVAVTIADAEGTELISSAPVGFVVRMPSIVNPPVGPLVPPKPPLPGQVPTPHKP
jgi:hypothetical protein